MTLARDAHDLPVGSVLHSVRYEVVGEHEPVRCDAWVDEVSMSVRLEFADAGPVTLRWLMQEEVESLALGPRGPGEPRPWSRWHDASDRWPAQVGATLTDVSWAKQSGPGGVVPWACRMSFSSGTDLVVALGECDPNGPAYMPDSLVVIGSTEVASRFRPPAAMQSAWAE